MLNFNLILDFSRSHCIAICAFLVPLNLVATSGTLMLTALHRPARERQVAITMATVPALLMIFHVFSWFICGVVMAPTFILLALAAICLGINCWAAVSPQSLAGLLIGLFNWASHRFRPSPL